MEKYTFEMDKDTKDKIEQIIKTFDLDVNINKTEQQEPEEKWPQDHNEYYFMFSDGDIGYEYFHAYSPANDDRRLAFGNCFRTKDEAVFEMERLIVINEMKKFAEPEDRVWDGINDHWSIYGSMPSKSIFYSSFNSKKSNCIYFESREKAEECLKTIGKDKIRKYYLGVEFKE